jgi:CheY-like chemotaxis protein
MIISMKKILIVEDELAQRSALRDKCGNAGFEIIEAKNGEDGLEMALKERPDAILLDVMMPKMDGLEMAKKLREDLWGSKVPVIILTNLSDMEKVQKAVENEILVYFVKSDTKIEHVVDKLKQLVG